MNETGTALRRRALMRAAGAGGALLLAGCGLVGLTRAPRLYTLTPKSTFPPDLRKVRWQLLVETPIAAAGLDTARIALTTSPITVDYFAGVSWTDRVPEMVQTLIVVSFENSRAITSVGRDSVGLRADYLLRTEIRAFQAEYDGTPEAAKAPPTAHVRINAKLISVLHRSIEAVETFDFRIAARDGGFDSVIAAMDDALGKAVSRLVQWTLETGREPTAEEPARSRPRPALPGL